MIYNYLLSSYLGQENYRNYTTAHKKSELKKIYNEIVKISKDSPSYLVKPTEETQSFVLQLKEGSLSFQDALEKLQNGGLTSAFSYKEVSSDNPSVLTAKIDTNDHSKLPESFTMKINSLAKPQVNIGSFMYRTSSRLDEGTYALQFNFEDQQYPLQLEIAKGTSNETVLQKLCNKINKSDIPITASTTIDKTHEKVRLVMQSDYTGSADGSPIFSCEDVSHPKNSNGLVGLFGLNQIHQMPENSSFEINGDEKSTLANEFTLNNSLHLKMRHADETPVQINFNSDSTRILSELDTILSTYNSLVNLSYHQGDPPKLATHMLHDLKEIFSSARKDLEECGIEFNKDGYMQINETSARSAAKAGRFEEIFGKDNKIGSIALAKSKVLSLDPMRYIEDKIIVSYPNPQKEHFTNPYMTSMYSGMLFNSYC